MLDHGIANVFHFSYLESEYLELGGAHKDQQVQLPAALRTT